MATTATDPHDQAYRAGLAGRQLSGSQLRRAEQDPSILDAWREGKSDRVDDQPEHTTPSRRRHTTRRADPQPTAPAEPTAADIARGNREREARERTVPTRSVRAPRRQASSSSGRRFAGKGLSRLKGRTPVETGANVILGMVAYALILSVVQYGKDGPAMWFKAKFLNEVAPTGSIETGPAGQAEKNTAVASAQAAVTAACAGAGAGSPACLAAQNRLADIQSTVVGS